jgi:hypothetical protein
MLTYALPSSAKLSIKNYLIMGIFHFLTSIADRLKETTHAIW